MIPEFTRDDFLNTTRPFDFIKENAKDQLHEEQLMRLIGENARRVGIRNFRKLYADYREAVNSRMRQERNAMSSRGEIEATAKKIALLLAESKASFSEVPMIFHQAQSYLSVSFNDSDISQPSAGDRGSI